MSVFSRNFISLLGSTFVVQALRFLTIALLARRLGSDVFGAYNYIILLITYGFTLVEFGLKNLAIREISQGRGSIDLVPKILKVRSFLALLGTLGVILFSYLAFPSGKFLLPALFFGLSLIVDAFLIDFILIAHEKLGVQALANISQALFVYIFTFIFVRNADQFALFSGIFLASHFLWVGLFYFFARPFFAALSVKTSFDTLSLAKLGLPFLIAQFLFSMQPSTDLLLLGQFHYANLLGSYGAAMKLLGIPMGIIYALMGAVYPRLAKYSHDFKSESLLSLLNATTRLIWIFVLPMVIGCWLFGEQLILWFFGKTYSEGIIFLKPLSISMGLFFLGLPPITAILLSHNSKLMIRTSVLNLGVSFLSSFLILTLGRPDLLPWAMIFAQSFFLIFSWFPFRKYYFLDREELKTIILPGFFMAIALNLSVSPALKFIFAALGYLVGLAILKIWRRPWVRVFKAPTESK
jgi:O-antigen/teichoic acid export membrane protein